MEMDFKLCLVYLLLVLEPWFIQGDGMYLFINVNEANHANTLYMRFTTVRSPFGLSRRGGV